VTICGSRSEQLAAAVAATIARRCQGIVSFGIAGGLAQNDTRIPLTFIAHKYRLCKYLECRFDGSGCGFEYRGE
jgi:hypothetical protein